MALFIATPGCSLFGALLLVLYFTENNPYITETEIQKNNIKVIGNNVLDDGLILWNNATEQWIYFFEQHFKIVKQYDIYYREYEQYNRVFLMTK